MNYVFAYVDPYIKSYHFGIRDVCLAAKGIKDFVASQGNRKYIRVNIKNTIA